MTPTVGSILVGLLQDRLQTASMAQTRRASVLNVRNRKNMQLESKQQQHDQHEQHVTLKTKWNFRSHSASPCLRRTPEASRRGGGGGGGRRKRRPSSSPNRNWRCPFILRSNLYPKVWHSPYSPAAGICDWWHSMQIIKKNMRWAWLERKKKGGKNIHLGRVEREWELSGLCIVRRYIFLASFSDCERKRGSKWRVGKASKLT